METETKLKNLSYYVRRGWPIFPCVAAGKKPLTEHGLKDATLDPEVIKVWHIKWPDANWAVRCGDTAEGGAGLVVVDIDKKSGGFATWEQLREENSEPLQTVTIHTGGGGSHLYFKYPTGHKIKSGTGVLGSGIDIRSCGGYVLVPPSKTEARYTFEFSPADCEIEELPDWILSKVESQEIKIIEPPVAKKRDPKEDTKDLTISLSALNALKKERADNYQQWLEVGMSLYGLGKDGLIVWNNWSKQSAKYESGACAQKWETFSPAMQDAHKITFASLIHWAEEDGMQPFIRHAPKGATPDDYTKALAAFGYNFTQNEMNDLLYVNDVRMSDVMMAVIEYSLRNYDYRSEKDTQIAIYNTAHEHLFHPIKDYLNSLKWTGQDLQGVDHINLLCDYFEDKDGVFPILIRKWLLGAVGRILSSRPGQQHPMLVLDGPQGIGKSRFTSWLGSPLPAFYIQNSINTTDKDFLILLCSKFVWEVEELGATLRKADIESLKAFLSKEIINVRKPYGHDEITKPATASFIGTINNSGGFLADPTGSRRFRVCTLTKINWDYEKVIDVNQVWAQAVTLFKAGETWELDHTLQEKMLEINNRYDVDDPIQFDLIDTFNVQPEEYNHFTSTAQIIHRLRVDGKLVGGSDQQIAQRIANVLVRLGCDRSRERVNGQQVRVWRGVWLRK